jgi:parallel beta-helix repeat protein
MVLTIRGTCNENVLIGRDDVTLQGDPKTGAMVNGPSSTLPTISVNAARVAIHRLTVTGGGQGIQVQGLWSMAITNCQIQNTALSGIYLRFGHARIVNNTIQNAGRNGVELIEGGAALLDNNLIQYNTIAGVQAQGNSTVDARGNTISANGSNGVALTLGSQGTLNGNTITVNGAHGVLVENGSQALVSANTITQNGINAPQHGSGVNVSWSSASITGNNIANNGRNGIVTVAAVVNATGNTITGHPDSGIWAWLGSTLNVGGGSISGNGGDGVQLITNTTAQVTQVTIQNNARHGIEVAYGSKLWLSPPQVTVGGNAWYGLWCNDGESSVNDLSVLVFSPPNGVGMFFCTGY